MLAGQINETQFRGIFSDSDILLDLHGSSNIAGKQRMKVANTVVKFAKLKTKLPWHMGTHSAGAQP